MAEHVDKCVGGVGCYERAFFLRVLCPFLAAAERFICAFVIRAADCFE